MKKLLLLVLSFLCLATFGQTAKEMLSEIEGKWEIDDNGNVTFVRVVEAQDIDVNDIFNRALAFFTYNYVSGDKVIQVQDKDAGLIIGKGVYKNAHIGISLYATYVDAFHIIRVDVKGGKARIIGTLTEYKITIIASATSSSTYNSLISKNYPLNPKGASKTVMSKAFYKSYQLLMKSFDDIEKSIKEGNTSSKIENKEW